MSTRPLDLVLFGATGFTGGLTADYLAAHGPKDCRWALAGRNRAKLEAVRARLAEANSALADLPLLVADAADAVALRELAASTKVVITTVGPYLEYGAPLVAACAAAGTDYVDLTGEPEFVDRMFVEHNAEAERTGARLVHSCGFDSIPHDIGAFFTVQHLPADEPITLRGVVRAGGRPSGGTVHSAITAISRANQMRAAASARRKAERAAGKRPIGRRSKTVAGKPHRDPVLGYWLLPLPTIDPLVVARSGAALDAYGPDFRYSHYAGTKTLHYAVGGALGVGSVLLGSQLPPLRRLMLSRVQQGEGPSERVRAKSWFSVDFVGEAGDRSVHTRVSGGDPGYDETAKMLAESALCLAFDENPSTSGQVTPAAAMGTALLERLIAAGITFETR